MDANNDVARSPSPVLLLMAVVDWDDEFHIDESQDVEDGFVGPRSHRRSQKIRITSSDVTNPPTVTFADLVSALRREQRQWRRPRPQSDRASKDPLDAECMERDGFVVRVYDASRSRDWISLPTARRNASEDADLDLVDRFGRRIRVEVSYIQTQLSSQVRLALQGRYLASEWLDDERIVVDDAVLRIHQQMNRPDTTAGCVWDGATLLARFLERNAAARTWIRNRHVLELGAGCGLAGIAAGALGAASVVLTDLECHLPLLRQNVADNSSVWKSNGCRQMVCYCVWMEELVDPLLDTIAQFATRSNNGGDGGGVRVIFSYQRRGKGTDDRFWKGLKERFESIEILSDLTNRLGLPDVLKLICARTRV